MMPSISCLLLCCCSKRMVTEGKQLSSLASPLLTDTWRCGAQRVWKQKTKLLF